MVFDTCVKALSGMALAPTDDVTVLGVVPAVEPPEGEEPPPLVVPASTEAGVLITDARTKPDFIYREQCVAVYVDGSSHHFADRALRDQKQQVALEDLGWTVLRFADDGDWPALIAANPATFGTGR